jgi:hypothetical protein
MEAGGLMVLTTASFPMAANAEHVLEVTVSPFNLAMFNVSLNGILLLSTIDRSFTAGAVGVYKIKNGTSHEPNRRTAHALLCHLFGNVPVLTVLC